MLRPGQVAAGKRLPGEREGEGRGGSARLRWASRLPGRAAGAGRTGPAKADAGQRGARRAGARGGAAPSRRPLPRLRAATFPFSRPTWLERGAESSPPPPPPPARSAQHRLETRGGRRHVGRRGRELGARGCQVSCGGEARRESRGCRAAGPCVALARGPAVAAPHPALPAARAPLAAPSPPARPLGERRPASPPVAAAAAASPPVGRGCLSAPGACPEPQTKQRADSPAELAPRHLAPQVWPWGRVLRDAFARGRAGEGRRPQQGEGLGGQPGEATRGWRLTLTSRTPGVEFGNAGCLVGLRWLMVTWGFDVIWLFRCIARRTLTVAPGKLQHHHTEKLMKHSS